MLSRRCFLAATATSTVLAIRPGCLSASLTELPQPLPPSTAIGSGEFVAAPGGWLRLIKRYPEFHPGRFVLSPAASSKPREAELDHVQRLVNKSVRFRLEDRDTWQPATESGDCEDFSIKKLEILTRRFGWSRGALTIATCYAETGEAHAVLLAHTTRGVYVLDNRQEPVVPWRSLPYRWLAREEPGSPFALWREINL